MKPRILNLGIDATHDTILRLANIDAPFSISDVDAFVIDPDVLAGPPPTAATFMRRKRELQDLIQKKGGIIICFFRPNTFQSAVQGIGPFNKYSLLEEVGGQAYRVVTAFLASGAGSSVTYINSARGPTSAYFQVLRQKLQFVASLPSRRQWSRRTRV